MERLRNPGPVGRPSRIALRSTRATSIPSSNKKGARSRRLSCLSVTSGCFLLRRRSGRRRTGGRVGLELLACFLGAFLQFFLQLLLGFLEHLGVGRRPV